MSISRFSGREADPPKQEDAKPAYKKSRARVTASVWEKGRGTSYQLTCGLQISYRDADNVLKFGRSFTMSDLKDIMSLLPEVYSDMEAAMAEELGGMDVSDVM